MIMIQDDPMPTGADKPLRITGDPHKVQVSLRSAQCVPLSVLFYTQFYTFYAFSLRLKHFISKLYFFEERVSPTWLCFTCRIVYPVFEFSSQQARELVVKLIRDKDQGDYRAGRADFGSKMGGSSLDVRAFFSAFQLRDSQLNLLRVHLSVLHFPFFLSTQVVVPRFAVGIIIGRNGEMIKKIQNDAGVRIQFKQGKED